MYMYVYTHITAGQIIEVVGTHFHSKQYNRQPPEHRPGHAIDTHNGSTGVVFTLRLGGISAVFVRYLLVFASGGGSAMMSIHVRATDEIKQTPIESLTGGENDADYMSMSRIIQTGICRYR